MSVSFKQLYSFFSILLTSAGHLKIADFGFAKIGPVLGE